MVYSFSLISFLIIFQRFLIPFLNANPSVEDNMLIAFMKGYQETPINEFSMQKYEAHLGILYYMRKNWQCDKIRKEFEEFERTECQKYRKYLDILYEYLYREYVGIPTVKPKFVFKELIEIEGPIIYAVNCLVYISQFYFIKKLREEYKYQINKLFIDEFEPKLLNEERLNYEIKLEKVQKFTFNEMILQLAIDTANEWQTNEIVERIIRQKFEEELEKMDKNAEEKAIEDNPGKANLIKNDKHWIIMIRSKFDGERKWIEDTFFSEFVKGLATNSEKFLKMAEECSNYLCRMKEKINIYWYFRCMISFGVYEIEKMKKHLTQKYEVHLGIMYLMRENWQCEKIGKEFEEYKRKICKKLRKYLDILYEYLFQLYAQAKSSKVPKQLAPLVKPIFIEYNPKNLIEIVEILNDHSKYFWKKGENELKNFHYNLKINLVNEKELHYEIKKEKSGENSSTQNEIEIANLRKEFEQKMEKMYENSKENAKKENAKLEKAIENAANSEEKKDLQNEYDEKFYEFDSSPFS